MNILKPVSNTSSLLSNSAKAALLLVQHSPKLQEVAKVFAKNLDIAHKIWSEIKEIRKDEKEFDLIEKPDTIMNAIYNDKYKNLTNLNDEKEGTTLNTSTKEALRSYIINDCKLIFEKHHQIALDSLVELENEYSEEAAIKSLKSILDVMKNSC